MASSPEKQIAFVRRVATSDKDRASFLANPAGFARKNKIDLDPGFAKIIVSGLAKVEKERLKIERAAARIRTAGQPTMNAAATAAAAAVVQTVSTVISGGVVAYTATKWKGGFEMAGFAVQPQVRGGRIVAGRLRGGGVR